MALLVRLTRAALPLRAVANSSVRVVSTTPVIQADYELNDPYEHATGREKLILQAQREGNDDPFNVKAVKRAKGTKSEPNKHDESMHTVYMWVEKGVPRRCSCGYWFELVDAKPLPKCPEFQAIPAK